ncbi:glycine betaine ABC transporter substrate-binding protein [Nocardioides sp. 31GB23]|jgi:osmoprotectant transport system substrate-binding protein|uniref:Osmoprotectant transport system substrate-binding protein n=1 Tax=Nocardioides salarius TaxID=374513 RepID=A0ABS2MCS1_9ACTN|nr:glycine betaine ABC transporter substrate-binding protein [Nocardioides salarius]MBM7508990.1 osmoprotectant transport system substrate-binding protein [Nocardioides salarius]
MRLGKKLMAVSAGVALSLTVTACGDDSSSASGSSDELDGVSLTVGSKDFTENILLGEMFAQALEARGASVDNKVNLGGTSVNRDALLSDNIDVYPEYNGTGWTVHLGNEEPSQDPQELYDVTAEADLEENDIKWVGLSPFNDTYGFAANGDLAEAEGGFDFQGMADYLEANPDATVCMETEFPDRPDGLVLWEDATGYELPGSQSQILDTGLIYSETSDGNCDFGEVFTTDGRITALNLELVEDPGVMIIYNSSFTMSNEIYEENAETYDEIADAIFADLDNEKMAELNAQVDVEGTPAERVAEQYLEDAGVL